MRYYTSRGELDFDDEQSEQNRVYKKIRGGPVEQCQEFYFN